MVVASSRLVLASFIASSIWLYISSPAHFSFEVSSSIFSVSPWPPEVEPTWN